MKKTVWYIIICTFYIVNPKANAYVNVVNLNQNKFPDDFLFGVATSAYQIEGAWQENGKGETIWDHFTRTFPEKIAKQANGEIACDSYHKYKEDVQLVKQLGVQLYRFSISWSRILPTGFSNDINENGIRYYKNLINELAEEGITPMVTMHHFDLPQPLQKLGGWTNPLMVDYFMDFARVLYNAFGSSVLYWTTFNEPYVNCKFGYGEDLLAPGMRLPGVADYLCMHHMIIAHARTYRLYKDEYQAQGKVPQNAKMSINIDASWSEPKSNKESDKIAVNVDREFQLGVLANPIFGSGDYPQIVKDFVKARSLQEGYPTSRLPEFTKDEVEYIKGSFDFFALNFYGHIYVERTIFPIYSNSSQNMDAQITISIVTEDPPAPYIFAKSPTSFRKILSYIKDTYNNPLIIVTENGYADDKSELNDCRRIQYIQEYLSALLEAIYEDNCNVVGYIYWSLLDNFEWFAGYEQRFGLYHVDFTRPDRKRTAKKSAREYANIIEMKKLPEKSMDMATCGTEINFVEKTTLIILYFLLYLPSCII